MAQFVAYPKALKLLADRLDASPEELAAWIWIGPNDGGLAAYLNANEFEQPPRFYFESYIGEDYLSLLMACWFLENDIVNFQPKERFITGEKLIERWKVQPGIQPDAFIRRKIAESRLSDIHPTYGGTQGSSPDDESYPLLESGLFAMTEVETVEAEDFAEDHPAKPPGHLNHDPELQEQANQIAQELKSKTGRPPTRDRVAQILAKRLKMDQATVTRRIRKQWK